MKHFYHLRYVLHPSPTSLLNLNAHFSQSNRFYPFPAPFKGIAIQIVTETWHECLSVYEVWIGEVTFYRGAVLGGQVSGPCEFPYPPSGAEESSPTGRVCGWVCGVLIHTCFLKFLTKYRIGFLFCFSLLKRGTEILVPKKQNAQNTAYLF